MGIVLTTQGEHLRKTLFPNVKNKNLLDVALINYWFFFNPDSNEAKPIVKRLSDKGCFVNRKSIAFELDPGDIVPLLGCSENKAKEYIDLLRFLFL